MVTYSGNARFHPSPNRMKVINGCNKILFIRFTRYDFSGVGFFVYMVFIASRSVVLVFAALRVCSEFAITEQVHFYGIIQFVVYLCFWRCCLFFREEQESWRIAEIGQLEIVSCNQSSPNRVMLLSKPRRFWYCCAVLWCGFARISTELFWDVHTPIFVLQHVIVMHFRLVQLVDWECTLGTVI